MRPSPRSRRLPPDLDEAAEEAVEEGLGERAAVAEGLCERERDHRLLEADREPALRHRHAHGHRSLPL